jgi:chaperonin GroEL
MDKVGKDVYHCRRSKGLEFETEYVEGMKFDRGYISSYFMTDTDNGKRYQRSLYSDL